MGCHIMGCYIMVYNVDNIETILALHVKVSDCLTMIITSSADALTAKGQLYIPMPLPMASQAVHLPFWDDIISNGRRYIVWS